MDNSDVTTKPRSDGPAQEPGQADQSAKNPSQWVELHGECLFRFALARVRHPSVAEDLVQESLLAALQSQQRFAGRSSERTWLVGILKNKVIDYFRKANRETVFTDLESLSDEQSHRFIPDGPYQGGWHHELGPLEWENKLVDDRDRSLFWETFYSCTEKLPEKMGRVFCLREIDELSSEEVCQVLGINPTNLWVMLHRARLALRQCLETNWFGPQAT